MTKKESVETRLTGSTQSSKCTLMLLSCIIFLKPEISIYNVEEAGMHAVSGCVRTVPDLR